MSYSERAWQWLGGFLAILLAAVILNEIVRLFPDAAGFIRFTAIGVVLLLIAPTGVKALLHVLSNGDGF